MSKTKNIVYSEFFHSKDFPNSNNIPTTNEEKQSKCFINQIEMQVEENIKEISEKIEETMNISLFIDKTILNNNEHKCLLKVEGEEEKPEMNIIRKINYLNEKKLNNQIRLIKKVPDLSSKLNPDCEIISLSENCNSYKNNFYYLDTNGKKVYNIEKVFDFLHEIDNNSALSVIIGSLLNEKKVNLIDNNMTCILFPQ